MTWEERIAILLQAQELAGRVECDINVLTHQVLFNALSLIDDQIFFCVQQCTREIRDAKTSITDSHLRSLDRTGPAGNFVCLSCQRKFMFQPLACICGGVNIYSEETDGKTKSCGPDK